MKTVLIVDDEYDIVSSLEMVLTMEGYVVRTAFHGKDALQDLRDHGKVDLIVSDVMMPVLDGYGFLEALQAEPAFRGTPVILMSAAQLDEARVKKDSFRLFVRKPFDLGRFVIAVAQQVRESAP